MFPPEPDRAARTSPMRTTRESERSRSVAAGYEIRGVRIDPLPPSSSSSPFLLPSFGLIQIAAGYWWTRPDSTYQSIQDFTIRTPE